MISSYFYRLIQSKAILLVASGSLLLSSTLPGITAGFPAAKEAVTAYIVKLVRLPQGPYTDRPQAAFLGAHPGRSETRGLWTADQIREHENEGLQASSEPAVNLMTVASSVPSSAGLALPWEGSVGTSSGSVNTGNGNKTTKIPLFGWKQRGGLPIRFTLYHNSEGSAAGGAGYNWTTSFDIYLNLNGSAPVVHWGDGLAIPYSTSGTGGGNTPGGGLGMGPFVPDVYLPTTFVAPAGIYDTLVQNSDSTFTLTKKDGIVYKFTSTGLLSTITDRNNNTATVYWTSANVLQKVVDATGRTFTVASTGSTLNSVTDPQGHTWTFSQNTSGDLTNIAWPALSGTTYSDSFAYTSHDITSHTDRAGNTWTATYSSGGLASETDPLGHTTNYSYSSTATTVTDPLGHNTVDNYSSGVLASRVDASSYTTNYTARDANYNPTSVTDARGKVWAYTYDSLGNVLTVRDPLSHVKTYTYNGFSEVLTSQDALSHTTSYTYDTHGNLITTSDPLSHVKTNTYDTYGELVTSEDALGDTSTLSYDSSGNLSAVSTPLGNATNFSYDGLGRLTSTTDPLGHAETTTYDAWGRKIWQTHADASSLSWTYNPIGQPLTATDENGHVTTYGYDAAERLSSLTNPRGDVETYGYDNANHRTSVTNGRGYTRTYQLSNRGEVTKLTMPDGIVTQWAYDGTGHTTAYVNGNGDTIDYSFDDAGRHTGVSYPSGTNTTFSYDNADRENGMTDATGTTSWTYDNADRLTALSTPEGSTSYGYDNADRKTSLVENGTQTTTYAYDNDSRKTSLTNAESETTTWTYDSAARVTSQTVASGEVSTFGYDNRNRQTSVSHANSSGTVLESETYVYDVAGNLTSKTVGSVTTTYGYDANDQLTSESNSGYSASYTYDANGNRTSKTLGGVTDTYTVDSGDKLTSTSTKTYTYDADGRTKTVVSSAGTTTLAYDYEGRVTSIVNPGGTTYTYTYNGLDTRVGKNEGTSQTFQRDGVGVTDPVLSDGVGHFTPGVSEHASSATTFNHADRLGSYVAQTNTSQAVTATKTFDAFGLLLASSGTPVGPFGFVGGQGYQNDASGLQLLGHRYYDSSTARFLTRDPVLDGRNWYGYVKNNPLRHIDVTGLFIWGLVAGIGGIFPGGIGSLNATLGSDSTNGHIGLVITGEGGVGEGYSGGGCAGFTLGQGSINGSGPASGTGAVLALPFSSGELDKDDDGNVTGQITGGVGSQFGVGAGGGIVTWKNYTIDFTDLAQKAWNGLGDAANSIGGTVSGWVAGAENALRGVYSR